MKYVLKIIFIVLVPLIIGKSIDADTNDDQPSTIFQGFNLVYPDHIAGAFTGGFGEQSCHSCHFDYELNYPEGELSVTGIRDFFEPGREYTINISVEREDMGRSGFQMTARFEDGSQAGHFNLGEDLTTTPDIGNEVSYVQHGAGQVEAEDGKKDWEVIWVAPDRTDKTVLFNLAANAANGDASGFGDWIYVQEIQLKPEQ